MINKYLRIASLGFLLFFTGSYGKVLPADRSNFTPQAKKVAIVSTIIGTVNYPKYSTSIMEQMDQSIWKNMLRTLSSSIIAEEMKEINGYRDSLGTSLKKLLKWDVLYGPNLVNTPEYKALTEKFNFPEDLIAVDDPFKRLLIPADEKNLFRFGDPPYVITYMDDYFKYKNSMAEICKILKVDLVVISYSRLSSYPGTGKKGAHASVRFETYLYIYNSEGSKIASENAKSAEVNSEMVAMLYQEQLKLFPDLLGKMMFDIRKDLQKKGYLDDPN